MNPDNLDRTVATWIAGDPDPASRAELAALNSAELHRRFSATIRFGTAGLRGPIQAGPGGMNLATVSRASDGLARWLIAQDRRGDTVVVGRDTRHCSEEFAAATAEILAAYGFDVVALPDPGPTPLVAFATRSLGAVAGVQITASHNPADDNGYKVYLDGGAQLIGPADREIEKSIQKSAAAKLVPRQPVIPDARARGVASAYLARCATRFPKQDRCIRIALTAMHGVGGELACAALAQAGFTDVHVVAEQFAPDPDFPTAKFPNPEEPGAVDLLLALAKDVSADLAIALDPDADRCAIGAVIGGRWRMLSGDETGGLFGEAILSEPGVPAKSVVATTIVSGSILAAVAAAHGVRFVRTLTGFKWLVRAGEPLVYAYEEAIGHCVDPDAVRDKDGITAALLAANIADDAARHGRRVADILKAMYATYGVYVTEQRTIRVAHAATLNTLMDSLRSRPPTELGGIAVEMTDYARRSDGLRTDALEFTGTTSIDESVRVFARPSGTEPKLKLYIQASAPPGGSSHAECQRLCAAVGEAIEAFARG